MLPKKERLTKKEFDRFFASGRRYHSEFLSIVHSPVSGFHGAVVVGKKVHKSAVKRNRLRRQIYSLLYRLSRDRALPGVYIILTKPAILSANFADIKAALEKLVDLASKK